MKNTHRKILGVRTKVSICLACGKELIDINEAIRAQNNTELKIKKG